MRKITVIGGLLLIVALLAGAGCARSQEEPQSAIEMLQQMAGPTDENYPVPGAVQYDDSIPRSDEMIEALAEMNAVDVETMKEQIDALSEVRIEKEIVEPEQTVTVYKGSVLAGTTAPLLDFRKDDYEQALATDHLIVLYFYADWCPICKQEVADGLYPVFNELKRDDVVGFRVNYRDNYTDENEVALARQFGVAYQHTKVFVKNGMRILKAPDGWDKARYLSEIGKY